VFVEVLCAFVLTTVWLLVLAPFAFRFGIVDRPDQRKNHRGDIPLIGGLAIFVTIATLLPVFSGLDANLLWYLAASGLLVLFGVLDDRFNIGVGVRVAVEVVAALMMIFGAGLWVDNLGNLLGYGDMHMPLWMAAPFTIIAVFGITNAWNMIDGMDGLVGTVTLIALGSFYFITHGAAANNSVTGLLLGATGAYLLFNLCSNRLLPKVFLGDAGSKLIGFSLVWLLIDSTQGGQLTGMRVPGVLALFVVGLPLIDMVTTTVRRMKKGQLAFAPDRTHIHHILQHAGFTQQEILLLIALLASFINLVGGLMYAMDWPAYVMFAMFWAITLVYVYYIEHCWKLGKWLQKKLPPQTN
jgi:UDP-GlcNAc:undecaprenyl-phosphate GlcNAc-1-phosphate transferase